MPEATDRDAPSAEHMLGHGFYSKHAQAQAAANRFGLDLIQQAIHQVDFARVGDVFRIADYGAAQGHNSLLPIKAALSAVRARGCTLPVAVTHTDLPTNDWTTLFQTVLSSPESYVVDQPNLFVSASGTSIYRHYEEFALADVFVDQYDESHDAGAFATADGAFFRAAFEPALFVALGEDRSAAERASLIERFGQRLERALSDDPASHSARWVLQLMWIDKGADAGR